MSIDDTFHGQRALVTGAASGLGAALADRLEAAGAEVLRTDLTGPESGTRTVTALDVTSDDDWARVSAEVLDRWGGLDLLVNNAGVAGGGRIEHCSLDEWRWITEINLFGVVRGVRAFTPALKAQGSGRILNTASLAGLVHPAGMGSYNAVKAAVVAFTETIGHELAAYGVTAHVACPSYFRTNLTATLRSGDPAMGPVMARLIETAPLSAADMAELVLQGVADGVEVIVPDEAARAAYSLKVSDRASYDAVMRAQAAKLDALAGRTEAGA